MPARTRTTSDRPFSAGSTGAPIPGFGATAAGFGVPPAAGAPAAAQPASSDGAPPAPLYHAGVPVSPTSHDSSRGRGGDPPVPASTPGPASAATHGGGPRITVSVHFGEDSFPEETGRTPLGTAGPRAVPSGVRPPASSGPTSAPSRGSARVNRGAAAPRAAAPPVHAARGSTQEGTSTSSSSNNGGRKPKGVPKEQWQTLTAYELLQVSQDAAKEDIIKSYREMARQ